MKVDKLSTATSAPKAANPSAPQPDAAPAIARDSVVVRAKADPAPAQPEEHKGPLKKFLDFYLGNTENKLFMLKFNSLHCKEKLLGLLNSVESGPVAMAVDKVKGLFGKLGQFKAAMASKMAAGGAEAGVVAKALGKLGKASGVMFRGFEKIAPGFGWLVAGQDSVSAVKSYNDKQSTGLRRGLLTATAGFSLVGAAASTLALSATAMAAIGATPALLGAVAIGCFGGSLLTGFLASKQKKST